MNKNNVSSPLCPPHRALAIAIAMALVSNYSHAAPAGGEVVGGSATFRQSSTTHFIHQETDRVAINWQSFSIDAGEKVQFVQPGSQSLALNRVIGNDASQIMGRLDANGHVILVNPHGIIFSRAARVNVNGLVASGLDINPQDFINGGLAFKAIEGTDGIVINRGLIKAASGGNVAMIGKRVANENMITAELGTVSLAAGREAVLTFDADNRLGVKITKDVQQNELGLDPAVLNSGAINAASGRVLLTASASSDIFSQAVNTGDLTSKTEVQVHPDGSFTLGRGASLVNSGVIDVSSAKQPGYPFPEDPYAKPGIDAGQVVMLGEDVLHTGTVRANALKDPRGGHSGAASGEVALVGASRLRMMDRGLIEALSGDGSSGDVTLLGQHIRLHERAAIRVASGEKLGTITVGGRGSALPSRLLDTRSVEIGTNARLYAAGPTDEWRSGNRSAIYVWSSQSTVVKGDIELAHASSESGSVHLESEGTLGFSGYADVLGVMWRPYPGQLRLKGRDLVVSSERSNTTIYDQSLQRTYGGGHVVLEAAHSITVGGEQPTEFSGISSIVIDSGSSMRIHAGESITLNNTVISSEFAPIELIAGILTESPSPRPLTAEGKYGIFLNNSSLISSRATILHSFAGIHAHNLKFSNEYHNSLGKITMTAEAAINVSLGDALRLGDGWLGGGLNLFVQPDASDTARPVLRESRVSDNPYIKLSSLATDQAYPIFLDGNLQAIARNIRGGGATHIDLSDVTIREPYYPFREASQSIHIEADTLAVIPLIGRGLASSDQETGVAPLDVTLIAHQGDIVHHSPVFTGGGNYYARAGGNIVFSRDPAHADSALYLVGWENPLPEDPRGLADVFSNGDTHLTMGTSEFFINTNDQNVDIKVLD